MDLSSVWQVRGKGGGREEKERGRERGREEKERGREEKERGREEERESGCGFDGCCSGTNQSACLTLESLLCECTRAGFCLWIVTCA